MVTSLLNVITTDSSIFQRAKKLVKNEEADSEETDDGDIDDIKLRILIRSGLIDDNKLPIVKRIVKKLRSDEKITMPAEREVLVKLIRTLLSIVTSDVTIYQKTKRIVKEKLDEKSVSQQQQKLMGLAYAYKKGEVPESEVSDEVKKMADTMSMKDLKDFASTKHAGLPVKKETVKESFEEETIEDEDTGENEMILRQLYFIQYAAEEIIDYFNMGYNVDSWFNSKVSAVHEKIKGLHSYIEGDKRLQDAVSSLEDE
jgi:hypothetical protein